MDLDLTGKRALVTGGTRGIGRAIVKALIDRGAAVAATYYHEGETASELIAELEQSQNGSFAMRADVSDPQSVAELAQQVSQKWGHVDILVNNASIIGQAQLQEMPLPVWQQIMDTNLTSVYLVTQAVLAMMGNGSSIINISSNLATVGMRGKTHYSASKAGVIGLSRSLCKEVGKQGIRVNVVSPGIIETEQIGDLTPEQRTRYAYLSALGRLGQPEEVASAVVFLASDLASFITGSTLAIDGGVGGIAAL